MLSVANLTRQDGEDFLALAPRVGIKTQVTRYALKDANRALADLKAGAFEGAAVLIPISKISCTLLQVQKWRSIHLADSGRSCPGAMLFREPGGREGVAET